MGEIVEILARQILDSRGNPTVEVDVRLSDGSFGRASVPSGASTGSHEVLELRDKDPQVYLGKGVEKAVAAVNDQIGPALLNNDPTDQILIDQEIVLRDATKDASLFGSNAIMGVSIAVSKAAAMSLKLPYYQYIAQLYRQIVGDGILRHHPADVETTRYPLASLGLPQPLFNVLNGGAHTNWQTTDIQEFMIIPLQPTTFAERLRCATEIYHHLDEVLRAKGHHTTVGDEGGFAPQLRTDEEALELMLTAIDAAGYRPGEDVGLGIDAAMSEAWKDGQYHLKIQKQTLDTEGVIALWESWVRQFPIVLLEDGLAEDDWTGWTELNRRLGSTVRIVGDDLLVTNFERIEKAMQLRACNTLLMKVNQIGTLTESLQAIALARSANWHVVVSHRSGETEDSAIADIVVGAGADYIKAGAPARGERLAKYNQLLRIEEALQHRG